MKEQGQQDGLVDRALAAKPDNPSSGPGSQMTEENRMDFQRLSSDLHAYTHTQINKCNTKGHASAFLDIRRCVWE